jgi:hypothetical protein
MEELQTLTQNELPWVSQRASMAIHLQESYDQGNITAAECRRLLHSLISIDALNAEADNEEIKSDLIGAVYKVIEVI